MKKTIQHIIKLSSYHIPLLDAELLVAHVLGKPREFVVAHPELKIGRLKDWKIGRLLKKRKAGVPLAYLTGHKEFFGLDFFVNKYVLIPRPDTELMAELVADRLQTTDNGNNVMLIDVGTGSGCIPISIMKALKHKNLKTFAIDISKKAIKVATKNAKKHNVNITFLQGNLLEPITNQLNNLQIFQSSNLHITITANLPYLTESQYQEEPSIQHEPKFALVADNNGLALYEELFQQINSLPFILSSLYVLLEIDPSQSDTIQTLIKTYFPNAKITLHKDLANRYRIVHIEI